MSSATTTTNSSSAFDFLLADPVSTPGAHTQPQQLQSASPLKVENGLDWLLSDSADVLAPHPDAFELELESIAALGALEGDFAATLPAFNPQDTFNPTNINLYTQYRGPAALSAYSGYTGYGGAPSIITVSSESLSTYGSAYEPSFEKHHLDLAAANSGAQHLQQQQSSYLGGVVGGQQQQPSLASLFPDIDLNLTTFNLSGVTPNSTINKTEQQQLPHSMLPRLSPPNDNATSNGDQNSALSRGSSAAYDSASPSYDPTDFGSYLVSAGALAGSTTYSGGKQVGSANGSIPNVPRNGNASLVSASSSSREEVPDHDPRKKYQCPTCPRSFARAFNLKTHMATHDPHRVKTFVCRHSGCGRSFSRKHDLGRHLVSIHQDSNPPTGNDATVTSSGSVNGSAPSATNGVKPKASSSSIGVGSTEAQRIWCDSCGRGWLAGSREACNCKGKERVH